jgi:TonB family protein
MLYLPRVFVVIVVGLLFACSRGGGETDKHTSVARSPLPSLASEQLGRGPCADDPRIGRVGFAGTPPVLLKRVEPSTGRIRTGVHGVVILEIINDPQGVPCSDEVLRSLRPDADEAAVNAVKQWRFTPAKLNGDAWPVAANVTIALEK